MHLSCRHGCFCWMNHRSVSRHSLYLKPFNALMKSAPPLKQPCSLLSRRCERFSRLRIAFTSCAMDESRSLGGLRICKTRQSCARLTCSLSFIKEPSHLMPKKRTIHSCPHPMRGLSGDKERLQHSIYH